FLFSRFFLGKCLFFGGFLLCSGLFGSSFLCCSFFRCSFFRCGFFRGQATFFLFAFSLLFARFLDGNIRIHLWSRGGLWLSLRLRVGLRLRFRLRFGLWLRLWLGFRFRLGRRLG